MKRVTILLDDDQLYRDLKAAAARSGRPVKDVVAEAFGDWLGRSSGRITIEAQQQRRLALLAAAELRQRLTPVPRTSEDVLREIREERAGIAPEGAPENRGQRQSN